MRNNIKKLISGNVTAHQVAIDTGIPRNTVYRIFTGEAQLDNVTLRNAELLNDYYIKLKEMEKMRLENLQELVRENVHVSEENGKYYAVVVEENGDEHDLAQANNVEDLHEQLKNFGQIK